MGASKKPIYNIENVLKFGNIRRVVCETMVKEVEVTYDMLSGDELLGDCKGYFKDLMETYFALDQAGIIDEERKQGVFGDLLRRAIADYRRWQKGGKI